jgi:hypothetical protein
MNKEYSNLRKNQKLLGPSFLVSEQEYNELQKAKRNMKYLKKLIWNLA